MRFSDPKYVGDPINAVKIFNEKEADELIVLDIDATVNGVEPRYERIAHLALESRMPLCYGGGITKASQARRIVDLGVEKIAMSAAALAQPALIAEVAGEVGGQSVVVVFDVRRSAAGDYRVWTHNGTRDTGQGLADVLDAAQSHGAGEIVVNSIGNDGVMAGYDLSLAAEVQRRVSVPFTMLGGAGSLADIGALISACRLVGAAAGSLFVFKGRYRAVLINYPRQDVKESLVRAAVAS